MVDRDTRFPLSRSRFQGGAKLTEGELQDLIGNTEDRVHDFQGEGAIAGSDLRTRITLSEDWIANNGNGNMGWTRTNSNGGTDRIHVPPVPGHPGILELDSGGNSNGTVTRHLGDDNLAGSPNVQVVIESMVRVPTLADVTDDYRFTVGLGSQRTGSAEHASGIYFEYNRAISENWLSVTAASGSRTKKDTGVPVTVDWFVLQIGDLTDDLGEITFHINGVQVTTHSPLAGDDFPQGSAEDFGPNLRLVKLGGTNARTAWIDFMVGRGSFASSRPLAAP